MGFIFTFLYYSIFSYINDVKTCGGFVSFIKTFAGAIFAENE
jgi:hypothetical protein